MMFLIDDEALKKIMAELSEIKSIIKKDKEIESTEKKYLSPKEAAKILHIDLRTIREYLAIGKIKHFKPAGRVYIEQSEIDAFLRH